MSAARTMAHFTADPRFTELEVVRFEPSAFHVSQLAGMAGCTVGRVVRSRAVPLPIVGIVAVRSRGIDDLPEVDPFAVTHVVFNGKDLKLAIRQARHVTLLPLRADSVVN